MSPSRIVDWQRPAAADYRFCPENSQGSARWSLRCCRLAAEAPRCHNEPDMIGACERHHLGITQAGSPGNLGRPSEEFGESGLIGVKAGEEPL
jgi:hypothetical protein